MPVIPLRADKLTKEEAMKNNLYLSGGLIALITILLSCFPLTCCAESNFGGLTFIGDRKGVCIEIEGKCADESISFELETCDENLLEKDRYKDKMPFTLLVPAGKHKLMIKKNGDKVLTDEIEIKAQEVLEYKLP